MHRLQAALVTLASRAGTQKTALGAVIWRLLLAASTEGRQIRLQLVTAHCGLPGNERADEMAKEASSLPQEDTPVDVRNITEAINRAASKERWPDSPLPEDYEGPVSEAGALRRTGRRRERPPAASGALVPKRAVVCTGTAVT